MPGDSGPQGGRRPPAPRPTYRPSTPCVLPAGRLRLCQYLYCCTSKARKLSTCRSWAALSPRSMSDTDVYFTASLSYTYVALV